MKWRDENGANSTAPIEQEIAASIRGMRPTRHFVRLLVAVLVLGCVGVIGFRAWRRAGARVHCTYASPDGQFEIVVYRLPGWFAFPGQGSDAPGYFQLRDARTGRVLRERSVEMIQIAEPPEWSLTNVSVKLLADWRLPR